MEIVKQTGFLYELRDTDYITGASPLIIPEVMPTGDWKDYVPVEEKQYKYAAFDTMSCTTFSLMNEIETWVIWHKAMGHFSQKQIEKLNSLGFFADGQFNCSDRFIAIMSDTMPNGNYFQNVADAVRHYGLLPEALLPFGGNNQTEYLNKNLITQDMLSAALKILEILEISYEWTAVSNIPETLKQCPIWCAIPAEAYHAVQQVNKDSYFDTYPPFIKPIPVVQYAMKVIVKVKPDVVEKPVITKATIRRGNKGDAVKYLQTKLNEILGCDLIVDGDFGFKTLAQVLIFQKHNGLVSDGIVGKNTWAKLEVIKSESKLDKWCAAIKQMEGAKPERNNPGNIRFVGQQYAINDNGFCKFDTYEHGYKALQDLIIRACTGKSSYYNADGNLYDFYNVYAPSSDGNNPKHYAEFVADYIGVEPTVKIKSLVEKVVY